MRRAALACATCLASVAYGGEPLADWQALQQALLAEVVDGDVEGSRRTWQTLVRTLASDDEIRGEALYWLGRAQLRDGDRVAARETLRECVRAGVARNYCLELLAQLEKEDTAVRSVPVDIRFDRGLQGFVHPWRYADKGTLRVEPAAANRPATLVWSTDLSLRREDELHLGFDAPATPPRLVTIQIGVESGDVWMLPELVDTHGYRYGWSADPTHLTEVTTLTWNLSAARPIDEGSPLLDLRRLDTLILRDVTSLVSPRDAVQEIILYGARVE